MRRFFLTKYSPSLRALMVAAVLLIALPSRQARAADSLGAYVGGAIGQSRVEATGQQIDARSRVIFAIGRFKENHSAFKVMVGIRPISLLGAELAYSEYGHPVISITCGSSMLATILHRRSAGILLFYSKIRAL
jgi:hypothetical protein